MNIVSLVFCMGSLGACLGVAWLAFPYAAESPETIQAWKEGMDAELFDDQDLGDFGEVSVLELMDYYMENPPVESATESAPATVRFQGC